MIFVSVGSRDYQFDRLLKEVDRLIETGIIDTPVFAQIGNSEYIPKHYSYKRYLEREEFSDTQDKAELIISHGGTGALVSALKKGKKVIAVPRLAMFGEHIDDHQMQIVEVLANQNYLLQVSNIEMLGGKVKEAFQSFHPQPWEVHSKILEIISSFLSSLFPGCNFE